MNECGTALDQAAMAIGGVFLIAIVFQLVLQVGLWLLRWIRA